VLSLEGYFGWRGNESGALLLEIEQLFYGAVTVGRFGSSEIHWDSCNNEQIILAGKVNRGNGEMTAGAEQPACHHRAVAWKFRVRALMSIPSMILSQVHDRVLGLFF